MDIDGAVSDLPHYKTCSLFATFLFRPDAGNFLAKTNLLQNRTEFKQSDPSIASSYGQGTTVISLNLFSSAKKKEV